MSKEQVYCNEEIILEADGGYEVSTLKCREKYRHKLPHKTKIDKDQYIYWSEGTV